MSSSDLQPSELGTKEYWDQVYEEEVNNFEEFQDEGEVWFGLESVEKMVDWVVKNVPAETKPYCLDIGAGNGILSIALAEKGYDASRVAGIDYSADSVRLARLVATQRGAPGLVFAQCDFIHDVPTPIPDIPAEGGWDLLLDKGTFDAIALADRNPDGSAPCDEYPPKVALLLKPGGYFLITSCNFTEGELRAKFETESSGLTYHSKVEHPTFTFGGKSGSVVCTVAFKRREG
ncbi:hypothetical protein BOTBODRAFT_70976 [Botryobasidium botryosum FD-172 SS1]|uniref:Protein-lysine N-methyltransferase EFM4 n=1 Tax=Botryobasidium botryosum (strain FD-172 SS1) TaxID=930990 RepID=A0A067LVV4_BOTB1|nr:hypothetical protein BOTBODRAFT_70976 [Botryobasidium botryosum FD-172 SS1]